MRVFNGLDSLPAFRHAVATMGSFDGVHAGHAELLRRVTALAAEAGGESVVLTFEPHPRYVLGSGDGLRLLSTPEEKLCLLERAGVDDVIVIPFTREFSMTSPREFVERYIAGAGIRTLVVGYNHRFGHNKEGDYNYLEARAAGLEVHMVEQQQSFGSKVSSTIVRQTVTAGMMERARRLLGHPYMVICREADDGTAEVGPHKLLPMDGMYEVAANGEPAVAAIEGGAMRLCRAGRAGRTVVEM